MSLLEPSQKNRLFRPVKTEDGIFVNREGLVMALCPFGIRKLRISSDSRGYCRIGIKRPGEKNKTISVHRLVMLAFSYREDHRDFCVDHIDGNPRNNNLSNLRWATDSENAIYGIQKRSKRRGNGRDKHRLSEADVICLRKRTYTKEDNYKKLAAEYGVDTKTIRSAIIGDSWKHIPMYGSVELPASTALQRSKELGT